MKAILISIKPKWVAKILNGEKTIEIRKTMPKCELPIDVYIYCTKDKETIAINPYGGYATIPNKYKNEYFNGKVVAKFTLNKVEEITPFEEYESPFGMAYKLKENKIICCQKAQLTYDEYNHYLKGKNGYAIHISDLEIFKPKELSEFYPYCKDEKCEYRNNHCSICYRTPLTKAPQSWCYVEVEDE